MISVNFRTERRLKKDNCIEKKPAHSAFPMAHLLTRPNSTVSEPSLCFGSQGNLGAKKSVKIERKSEQCE